MWPAKSSYFSLTCPSSRDFDLCMKRFRSAVDLTIKPRRRKKVGPQDTAGSVQKETVEGIGKGGALFFAVCRGKVRIFTDSLSKTHLYQESVFRMAIAHDALKVSEGIDFADRHARAVFVVGIPYPSAHSLDVVLKKKHCDKARCVGSLLHCACRSAAEVKD